MARRLADNGADVNLADYDCYTPLHYAVQPDGDPATVNLLLEKGARVNQKNCLGETPLHLAAYLGCADMVQLLLANGADSNARDRNGDTPLHKTAGYGWEKIAVLLLAAGANRDCRNQAGETPFQKAVSGHWQHLAEVLAAAPGSGKPDKSAGLPEQLRQPRKSAFVTRESAAIRAAARDYLAFIQALNKTNQDTSLGSEGR